MRLPCFGTALGCSGVSAGCLDSGRRVSIQGCAGLSSSMEWLFPMARTMPSPWSWLQQDISHQGWVSGHFLRGSDTFLGL